MIKYELKNIDYGLNIYLYLEGLNLIEKKENLPGKNIYYLKEGNISVKNKGNGLGEMVLSKDIPQDLFNYVIPDLKRFCK